MDETKNSEKSDLPPYYFHIDNPWWVNENPHFQIVPDDGKPDLLDNPDLAPEQVVLKLPDYEDS